jgi:hypothetical protein
MPAVGPSSQTFAIAATNDGKVFSDHEGGLEVSTVTLAGGGTLASREEFILRNARAVAVQGLALGVVDSTSIRVYSLVSPAVPALISATPLPVGERGEGACFSGTRAYVALSPSGRLQAYSLANPAAPTLLGESVLADRVARVLVEGDLAYAYSSDGTLRVYDVTLPDGAVLLGSYAAGAASNADLRLRADGVLSLTDQNAVRVLDVRNPAAIAPFAEVLPTPGSWFDGAEFVGDEFYTLEQPTLLCRYDLSNPSVPALAATFGGSSPTPSP